VEYHLVSGVVDVFKSKVNLKVFSLDGILQSELDTVIEVSGNGSHRIDLSGSTSSRGLDCNSVLVFTFNDEAGQRVTRSFDNIVTDYEKAISTDVDLTIDSVNEQEKTLVLRINTSKYLRNLWVSSIKFGIKFDRNFESILPGGHQVLLQYETLPAVDDFKLMWL
ncbi:MAG: hypothetical protein P8N52_02230, partial [Crocinitomicaceae bacterium]|nr:hypothetical protein [Crocinitomicaceae bacterium]